MTLGQGDFIPIPSLKEEALFIRLLVTVGRDYELIVLHFRHYLGFGADWAEKRQEGS